MVAPAVPMVKGQPLKEYTAYDNIREHSLRRLYTSHLCDIDAGQNRTCVYIMHILSPLRPSVEVNFHSQVAPPWRNREPKSYRGNRELQPCAYNLRSIILFI